MTAHGKPICPIPEPVPASIRRLVLPYEHRENPMSGRKAQTRDETAHIVEQTPVNGKEKISNW